MDLYGSKKNNSYGLKPTQTTYMVQKQKQLRQIIVKK